jgi:hypothetical protein
VQAFVQTKTSLVLTQGCNCGLYKYSFNRTSCCKSRKIAKIPLIAKVAKIAKVLALLILKNAKIAKIAENENMQKVKNG